MTQPTTAVQGEDQFTVHHHFSSIGPVSYYKREGEQVGHVDVIGRILPGLPTGTVITVRVYVVGHGTPVENPYRKGEFA